MIGAAGGALVVVPAGATPQTRTLLARPDIAAHVDQVLALDPRRRRDLDQVCAVNCRRHSLTQIRICHRVSKADPAGYPHHAAVRALVWEITARPRDDLYAAAVAASDAAFVLLAGDLLDPQERVLFDGPWRAVVGDPVVTVAATPAGADGTHGRYAGSRAILIAAQPRVAA